MTKKATTAPGSPDTDNEKDPLIGKKLGDYRLTSKLATGGMARIYKGMDERLGRNAAIKVLSQEDVAEDKTLTKRFQREARAVAALEHDNIITIYQYGEEQGVYFLAMKLIRGNDLSQELKKLKKAKKKMDVTRALRIMTQVASALDSAHTADVIHRDIKPSNILLDEDDKAILTDFGLVLRASVETTMGTAFGTPRYIAPEQAISSNKAGPQSDIYSLAVIVYEILTGETPFTGDSPMEIALSHISDPPPPLRSKDKSIPEAVEEEVLKALDKEPERRHKTATEFITSIKRAYDKSQPAQSIAAPGKANSSKPATKGSTEEIATIALNDGSIPKGTAAPKQSGSSTDKSTQPLGKTAVTADITKKRRARRGPMLILALILGIIAGGAGFYLSQNLNIAAPGAPVALFYSDNGFAVVNLGDYTLNVADLDFVRGAANDGGDDYSGDRITGDILPAGNCARIVLAERSVTMPAQCQREQSKETLVDATRFFWRTEPVAAATFEVHYKGSVIARCPTVGREQVNECRFNWPEPPPTPAP